MIFRLGEIGLVDLYMGPAVIKEADEVVRRKAPESMPGLARLLDTAGIRPSVPATARALSLAYSCVQYSPDAQVLAEAICASADWFIPHDKDHFLRNQRLEKLPFRVGTPGDFLHWLRDNYLPAS